MEVSTEPLWTEWRKMAKEMESRRRTIDIDLDHAGGQDLDQAALIAAILAQREGHMVPVAGPDWAAQFRPPAIPGTLQDKYAKAGMPVRAVAFFFLWVTWDWKRGAFVLLVLALITAIFITR
jgi:hypothetical protein